MEKHAHHIGHRLFAFLSAILLPVAASAAAPAGSIEGQYVRTIKWIAFQTTAGTDLWKVDAHEVDMIDGHALEVDGDLVAVVLDRDQALWKKSALHVPGLEVDYSKLIVRFDRATGKVRWAYPLWQGQKDYSNLMLFNGYLYIGLGSYLQRHDPATGACLRRWFIGWAMDLKVEDGMLRVYPHFSDNELGARLVGFHYSFDGEKVLERTFLGNNLIACMALPRSGGAVPKFSALGPSGGPDCYLNQRSMLPLEKKEVDVDLPKVEQFFRAVTVLDAGNPQYHFYLGQALYWQGRKDEAKAAFEEAVRDREELGFFEYGWLGQEFEFLYMPEWADRCYEVMQAKYFQMVPYRPPHSLLIIRLIGFAPSRRPILLLFSSGNHARAAELYGIQKRMFPYCEGDEVFSYFYAQWLERNDLLPEAEKEERYFEQCAANPFGFAAHLRQADALANLWVGATVVLLVAAALLAVQGWRRRCRRRPIPGWVWRFILTAGGAWVIVTVGLYVFLNHRMGLARVPVNFPAAVGNPENELFIRDLIRKKPNVPYGHFLLGLSLQLQGRNPEAETEYRNAGDLPEAMNNLGILYAESKSKAGDAWYFFSIASSVGRLAAGHYNDFIRSSKKNKRQSDVELWKARIREPELVDIQEKYLKGEYMLAPVDPVKFARLLREWHSPLSIIKQYLEWSS